MASLIKNLTLFMFTSCALALVDLPVPSHRNGARSVVDTDVLIVGGGSAGTYAAIGLLDKGVDLLVIEQQPDLGGHADTYTDPATGQFVNAGVQIFHNISLVKEYAKRLGVTMTTPSFSSKNETALSLDFRTGQSVANPARDPGLTPALKKYIDILNTTYPYLANGFYLPDPVPEDLLLPFGEFAKKHGIEPVVYILNLYAQGFDIAKVPTVYCFVLHTVELVSDIISGSFLTIPDTNWLYRNASQILGKRVFYEAKIQDVKRSAEGVTVNILTKCGSVQTVRANKILMTGPPVLDNLQGWDLTAEEKDLFSKFRGYGYFAGVVINEDLPSHTSFGNVDARNETFHDPQLPALFNIGADGALPDKKRLVYYATDPDIDHDLAAQMCLADIDALVGKLGYGQAKTKLVAWYPHGPFNIEVSAEDIKAGFYRRLYGLQGTSNTWWAGATFTAQSSATIWEFVKKLIEDLAVGNSCDV